MFRWFNVFAVSRYSVIHARKRIVLKNHYIDPNLCETMLLLVADESTQRNSQIVPDNERVVRDGPLRVDRADVV